jgi:hypothetical protein
MMMRVERAEPGLLELATDREGAAEDLATAVGLALIMGALPSAGLMLLGAGAWPWGWGLLAGFNALSLWVLAQTGSQRMTFEPGRISLERRSTLFPFLRTACSWAADRVRVSARFMNRAYATVLVESVPAGPSDPVFSVRGVWLPVEFERFREQAGLPGPAASPPEKIVPPPWKGEAPGGGRILRCDDRVLAYRVPQSARLGIGLFAAGAAALLAGLLALRKGGPGPLVAGIEATVGALVFSAAVFRAAGSLRLVVDGERHELADVKNRPFRRVPFPEVRAVVLRTFDATSGMLAALHRSETILTPPVKGGSSLSELEAFGGEIARRIGVPFLRADGRRDPVPS